MLQFTRISLVGGVLLLVPLLALAAILGKAFAIAHMIVMPLAGSEVSHVETRQWSLDCISQTACGSPGIM